MPPWKPAGEGRLICLSPTSTSFQSGLKKPTFRFPIKRTASLFYRPKKRRHPLVAATHQPRTDPARLDPDAVCQHHDFRDCPLADRPGLGSQGHPLKNSRQTFFKGWMMLAMRSSTYKMGPKSRAMAIITLVNVCRLVITSVFVGTTATLVFRSSIPDDVSQKDSLLSALHNKSVSTPAPSVNRSSGNKPTNSGSRI